MLPYASMPFQQAVAQLKLKLFGVEGEAPRWEKCTKATDNALGFATGALYVDKYFSDADRLQVNTVLKVSYILVSLHCKRAVCCLY